MKRAFTIVELLVAMGLLAAILAGSSVVFAVAVNAQRTANATAEIAQKLRGITDQLNVDFRGLQKDCPLAIWFELDAAGIRHDQILFFADSNFSSYHSPTIIGNIARVYYGQANIPNRPAVEADENYQDSKMLARRQHVYFSSATEAFPDITDVASFVDSFIPEKNDYVEYDSITLFDWKGVSNELAYNNQIITTCFDNTTGRPAIDLKAEETLHMLMCKGVGNFTIQLFNPGTHGWFWFPSNGLDFDPGDEFGYCFNMPGGDGLNDWISWVGSPLPKALKFTFTLYDSIGVFKDGKTFTHIVYLEE